MIVQVLISYRIYGEDISTLRTIQVTFCAIIIECLFLTPIWRKYMYMYFFTSASKKILISLWKKKTI